MEQYFEEFNSQYDNAIDAIVKLREAAQEIKDRMDEIIDSCEIIEGEL